MSEILEESAGPGLIILLVKDSDDSEVRCFMITVRDDPLLHLVEYLHLHICPGALELMLAWTIEMHLCCLVLDRLVVSRDLHMYVAEVFYIEYELPSVLLVCTDLDGVVLDLQAESLGILRLHILEVDRRLMHLHVLHMLRALLVSRFCHVPKRKRSNLALNECLEGRVDT